MEADKKENYLEYLDLVKELRGIEGKGIELMLEGEDSGAEAIARACVLKDESRYMQEYIDGKNGKCGKVNFIRI